MPNFNYLAVNELGAKITGAIEADSAGAAENILVARGLTPLKIKGGEFSQPALWLKIREIMEGGVKTPDLILFTKQFRSMFRAGISILRLLQILGLQTENLTLKRIVASMSQDISQGLTISEAMEKYPKVFSPLYRSMINAGEQSGNLPAVMERLIYIIDHDAKIRSDIKSVLLYPKIVLIALGIAFFVLLTFVIPKFVVLFTKVGIALPLPTKMALFMYTILSQYWYLLLAGTIALIVVLKTYFKTKAGSLAKDTFLLRIPLLGHLFKKAAMSRFASIFAILHSSGVSVMGAMTILSGTIGNTAISREFDRVQQAMAEGQGISGPLKSAHYFPPMVVDMVAVGEESGNIEEMLNVITTHYDDEVAYEIKRLSDSIGPILIVGLAAVVGFFALAIFLPMWDLTKIAK